MATTTGSAPGRTPSRSRARSLGVTVVMIGCVGCVFACQQTGPTLATEIPPVATVAMGMQQSIPQVPAGVIEGDLDWLTSILTNPANTRETRAGAARRILAIDSAEAIDVIAQALQSGEEAIMLAVLDALGDPSVIQPALLEPITHSLRTAPAETVRPLSVVISHYGEAGIDATAVIAHDASADDGQRLGAIQVLGSMRSRDAVVHLMALLDPETDASSTVRDAVCDALARATGLMYGRDAQRWREWWETARDEPESMWMSQIIDHLNTRIGTLEKQIADSRAYTDHVEKRLIETYQTLFPALSIEEQLTRLPALLEDKLTSVRYFAMSRLERFLRDTVRIPDDVQQIVAGRLSDSDPAIRLEAAQLLTELNFHGIAESLVERLRIEDSPEVIVGLLDLVRTRPSPAAADVLMNWIAHTEYGDASCEVLWHLLTGNRLSEEKVNQLRTNVAAIYQNSPTYTLTRLHALLCDPSEIPALEQAMAKNDARLSASIAEGFAARGEVNALLPHAVEPAIYPYVINAILAQPITARSARLLSSLPVMRDQGETWRRGVTRVMQQMSFEQLIEADAALLASAAYTPTLRRTVLEEALARPADDLPGEVRADLLGRLAPLLIDQGAADQAYQLLGSVTPDTATPSLVALKFTSALQAGHFDAAAQLHEDALMWIEELEALAARHPEAARAVAAEIERRFRPLDKDLKTRLAAVEDLLDPEPQQPASEQPPATGT